MKESPTAGWLSTRQHPLPSTAVDIRGGKQHIQIHKNQALFLKSSCEAPNTPWGALFEPQDHPVRKSQLVAQVECSPPDVNPAFPAPPPLPQA